MARFNYDIRRRKFTEVATRAEDSRMKLVRANMELANAKRERDEAQRRAYIAETARRAFAQDVKLTPSSLKLSLHVLATMRGDELLRTILREVVSRWDDKMHRAIVDVARRARTMTELREALAPWVVLEGFEPWEVWR